MLRNYVAEATATTELLAALSSKGTISSMKAGVKVSQAVQNGRMLDLMGKRFGTLTVTTFVGVRKYTNGNASMWSCNCDCGSSRIVMGRDLTVGRTKSCGQGACRGKLAKGVPALRYLYRVYKSNAKKGGKEWSLSLDEFSAIISQPCHYTGRQPSPCRPVGKRGDTINWNGIDRIDSSKGYTADNCVPCCYAVNRAKAICRKVNFWN